MSRRPSLLAFSNRRKWVASVLIVMVSARMLDITDGSAIAATARPAAQGSDPSKADQMQQRESGDFLAMSDVFTSNNLTAGASGRKNFRVSRSELSGFCANGECGGGDVLRVVSQMAKRMLSDPRILGLRTGEVESHDEHQEEHPENLADASAQALRSSEDSESARAVSGSNFDTRPFTSNDYYYDTRNRADSGNPADSYAMATNGNYRNRDRYMADGSTAGYGQEVAGQPASSVAYDRDGYGYGDSYGHDDYGGYSGGGGHSECCHENNKLLPIFLIGLLGLLAFFLYLRSTTTTAAGRSFEGDDNDISDVLLDGPTWLSLVHELWEQDGALENVACAQETLCRMNRLAMAAPGQAGWAVSLSSLPLSYLLHTRHTGGFSSYMDASLMGRSGVNCTELYSSCPRLH